MGVMDRFLNAIRLNSDDEDDLYDDDYYDDMEDDEEEEEDYEPRRRGFFASRRERNEDYDYEEEEDYEEEDEVYTAPRRSFASRSESQQSSSKITPMRSSRRNTANQSEGMKVSVIKPISVEDAREITETLIANRTVILNLEGLDLEIAQRIIDFTSGSCYAISGNLQKISTYIFVVTPANVDITGDFQNIMGSFGGSSFQTDI